MLQKDRMSSLSTRTGDPLTVFEKLSKVSRNNLLPVVGFRDQLVQSVKLDIMFIVGDRNPS